MHDYFSSDPTVASSHSDAILALGKELTKQLGLDQSVDTLGRWMAHYIAELIHDTQNASAKERPAKLRICSQAILQLWQHRHELPTGKRPFQELESILRVLQSLDPECDIPRYFHPIRSAADKADVNSEAMSWLKLIDGLDYSAKLLIRHWLLNAAQTSIDKSAHWVTLAEAAGIADGIESPVVRVLISDHNLLKKLDEDKVAREVKQERIAKLEGFVVAAQALIIELRSPNPSSAST